MMNKIEEAIIYATVMHQGKVRKPHPAPHFSHFRVSTLNALLSDPGCE